MSESNKEQNSTPPASNPDKEAKKAAKAAAKQAKKDAKAKAAADRAAAVAAAKAAELDAIKDICSVRPVMRSRASDKQGRKFTLIKDLTGKEEGQEALIRARVHSVRAAGNLVFVLLRQREFTLQAVGVKSDSFPKAAVKFVQGLSSESIIDITGTLGKPEAGKVESASVQDLELSIKTVVVVSAAEPNLPFQLDDASTPQDVVDEFTKNLKELDEKIEAEKDEEKKTALLQEREELARTCRPVANPTRFNNRCIDLRTSANQAIFRIQAGVVRLFRRFLWSQGFNEIHTPKMIGFKSEGGANVFDISYFGGHAYLAQSPQFYKQMCICSDMDRVFEIGPVFRAEDSNTPRHMTEFIGMDLEMAFNEHYHEVLDVMDNMFESIFTGLQEEHKHDIALVSQQYPVTPFEMKFPSPLVPFSEGVKMLNDAGVEQSPFEDLSTVNERTLGQLVKEKFGTDFYRLDKFPTAARPFYTMLDADDEKITNSYDFMIRGQEILSGAQRIHDSEMLIERAKVHGVDLDTVEGYTSAFKYGAPPHAGGGIGLNRVTMLFLGLDRITKASLFPRLPKRLYP
mmetsp:Transcript_20252/g.34585  ORF Transcript_20252/g.34585 Transcript_20252/m.34585 type:complete len:571 (+) Transcript_20252:27-1739(+)